MIKLQESELRSVVQHLTSCESDLREIRQTIDQVVHSMAWHSTAAANLRQRWRRRAKDVDALIGNLEVYKKNCAKHADYADRMNDTFHV